MNGLGIAVALEKVNLCLFTFLVLGDILINDFMISCLACMKQELFINGQWRLVGINNLSLILMEINGD